MKKNNERHKIMSEVVAFTLAEVLITLVIIGVVSALTIPNLLKQHKKQEYSARLKKFYSTMQQASIKAKSNGKPWEEWAVKYGKSSTGISILEEFADDYLLPYLAYSKKSDNGVWYSVYFSDGTFFKFAKGHCIDFVYDVNGDRKPNVEGRDMYRFLFCPMDVTSWIHSGTFIPYQPANLNSREQAKNLCANLYPYYCSTLLMMDNWEFQDDYPYKL